MKSSYRRAVRFALKNENPTSVGFVYFVDGNPTGWAAALYPISVRPGVLAVALSTGKTFIAAGGNPQKGAERWDALPLQLEGFSARSRPGAGGDNEHALSRSFR